METKLRKWILSNSFEIFVAIIIVLLISSWFINYPTWLDHFTGNSARIIIGLLFLYNARSIRFGNKKIATIYMIIGVILIVMAFIKFLYLDIITFGAFVYYIIHKGKVLRIKEQQEEILNS